MCQKTAESPSSFLDAVTNWNQSLMFTFFLSLYTHRSRCRTVLALCQRCRWYVGNGRSRCGSRLSLLFGQPAYPHNTSVWFGQSDDCRGIKMCWIIWPISSTLSSVLPPSCHFTWPEHMPNGWRCAFHCFPLAGLNSEWPPSGEIEASSRGHYSFALRTCRGGKKVPLHENVISSFSLKGSLSTLSFSRVHNLTSSICPIGVWGGSG